MEKRISGHLLVFSEDMKEYIQWWSWEDGYGLGFHLWTLSGRPIQTLPILSQSRLGLAIVVVTAVS